MNTSTLVANTLAKDLPIGAYFYFGFGHADSLIGEKIKNKILFQRIEASMYVKKIKCYNSIVHDKSERKTNCIITLRCDCGEIYGLDNNVPVHHIEHDIILVDGKA